VYIKSKGEKKGGGGGKSCGCRVSVWYKNWLADSSQAITKDRKGPKWKVGDAHKQPHQCPAQKKQPKPYSVPVISSFLPGSAVNQCDDKAASSTFSPEECHVT
jgi:hypothetical protein